MRADNIFHRGFKSIESRLKISKILKNYISILSQMYNFLISIVFE